MTDTDLAWAAGVIDGEGCITGYWKTNTRRGCWIVKVNVSNTDPRMPVRMKRIFGLGSVCASHSERKRVLYEWVVVSRQAKAVLEAVKPFLVIKQEQAEVALAIAATLHPTGGWHAQASIEVIEQRMALKSQLEVLKRTRPTLEEVS